MLSKLRIPWGRIWSSFSDATFLKTAIPYPPACSHNGWEELKPEEKHGFPYPLLLALMQTTTTFPPVQPYKGKASLEVSPESSASPHPAARSCLRKELGSRHGQRHRPTVSSEHGARPRPAPPAPSRPHTPLRPPQRLTEPSQPLQQPRGADSSGAVVHSAPFLRDKEKASRYTAVTHRYTAVTGRPLPSRPPRRPPAPERTGLPPAPPSAPAGAAAAGRGPPGRGGASRSRRAGPWRRSRRSRAATARCPPPPPRSS